MSDGRMPGKMCSRGTAVCLLVLVYPDGAGSTGALSTLYSALLGEFPHWGVSPTLLPSARPAYSMGGLPSSMQQTYR